jgi:anti-sigma regulatory factor (Ser/Thr protein kinase)
MTLRITSSANRVTIEGELGLQDFRRVLARIHGIVRKEGYEDVIVNFGSCRHVHHGAMAAIVAEIARLSRDGIHTTLGMPTELRLRNLFVNAGWAHHLDPNRFDESQFRGNHVPLSQFGTSTEQGALVNRVLDTLLKSATQLGREDFAAVEWAINEIADNVLVHSESAVGGFVDLTNSVDRDRVEVIVADAGIGIPRSLRAGIRSIRSDSDALEQAIREGVTRNAAIGQGNGLYGSYQIAEGSGGDFHVHSGYASLEASHGYLKLHSELIPYTGTLIVAGMDYSHPDLLANALRLGGEKQSPTDHIELKYEMDTDGDLTLDLSTETQSFGSRDAGEPVRTKILNLYRMVREMRTLTIVT